MGTSKRKGEGEEHLCYFSIAVIRHNDQSNLYKKGFIWGLAFQRVRGHAHHGGEHISRCPGMGLELGLSSHVLRHNHEVERQGEWHQAFETSKPTSSDPPPPSRPHLFPSQRVPPIGDQVFKHEPTRANLIQTFTGWVGAIVL